MSKEIIGEQPCESEIELPSFFVRELQKKRMELKYFLVTPNQQ
jgi:hypothetical protein